MSRESDRALLLEFAAWHTDRTTAYGSGPAPTEGDVEEFLAEREPIAPPRFWRVRPDDLSWRAYQCNAVGEFQDYITYDELTRDYPLTREQAERDGEASGLEPWKGEKG